VGPRAGLDDVEKRKLILDLTGTRIPTPGSSSQWPFAIPTALSFVIAPEIRPLALFSKSF
jgi:hypothetical protein